MAQVPEEYRNNDENSEEKAMFPPVPAGEHIAVIEESEYIENREQTGMNLKLVWQIVDGPNKGSKLFEYLCLEHVKIGTKQQAWRTLNKINDICGFSAPDRAKDSSQLHNIPMIIDVKCDIEKDFPNSIKKHESLNDKEVVQPVQQENKQGTPPAAVNTGADNFNKPPKALHPWEKK